ncbi:MAG: N-acetylmuramoyl-L-alanine amidase [Peptococcaceae bacterium]|nr:N-acetylmuramoyl-L-alanine amidase [Peptococcaceae bacterium]
MDYGVSIYDSNLSFKAPLTMRTATTTHLILHHAYTNGSVQYIHQMHKAEGMDGIGYHFYVLKSGLVYKGRGWEYLGAHAAMGETNCNPYSIGICFEGDYHDNPVTMPNNQFNLGSNLIAVALSMYPTINTICGHRDMMATDCPGQYFPLNEIIQEGVRRRPYAYINPGIPNVGGGCPYPEPTVDIQIGSVGEGVSWVQWYLNQNGANLAIDGGFGPLTDSAVRTFQSQNTLIVDGIVGPATRAKLKASGGCPYPEPSVNLQTGSTGDGVRWVQWHLNRRGANLVIDGGFGPLTDSAVRNFQNHNALIVDGIVGPATRAKLK